MLNAETLYKKVTSEEFALAIAIFMIAFGSWANAQGGWVKDFAFNKTVVLPFLFKNYHTTGFVWYLVGIFDDISGFFLNVFGFLLLRRSGIFNRFAKYGKNLFIIPLIIYIALDFAAFLNFDWYYSGSRSLITYGLYWNIILYFGMLPAFFITDLIIMVSKPGKLLREK